MGDGPDYSTIFDTNPANPQSAGKLKDLWDAVRQASLTPTGMIPDDQSTPYLQGTVPQAQVPNVEPQSAPSPTITDVPGLQRHVPNPNPTPGTAVTPVTPVGPNSDADAMMANAQRSAQGPSAPGTPNAVPPSSADSLPMVASPNAASMPSAARVGSLQQQVDAAYAKPTLKQKLQRALPIIGAVGAAAALRAPSFVVGANQGVAEGINQSNTRRQGLTTQLDMAQKNQTEEYNAAQRAQEQANAAIIAARERADYARVIAQSREGAAQTGADARMYGADQSLAGRVVGADAQRDVANTRATSANQVANTRGGYQLSAAEIAARAKVESGKYSADAAANRQTRGFDHADDKPTADEDRRADLSIAASSYMRELRDIAVRRPELFGPPAILGPNGGPTLGARGSDLRFAVGTNDPDVAALHRLHENIGTTMTAAHSLRNAGHIPVAADNTTNFNQSADSLIKNIDDGIAGMTTFQKISRPTLRQQTAPSTRPAAAPAKGKDPLNLF